MSFRDVRIHDVVSVFNSSVPEEVILNVGENSTRSLYMVLRVPSDSKAVWTVVKRMLAIDNETDLHYEFTHSALVKTPLCRMFCACCKKSAPLLPRNFYLRCTPKLTVLIVMLPLFMSFTSP